MRKVVIDCGANVGNSLRGFMVTYPDREIYAFEPNPVLIPAIARVVASNNRPQPVTIANQAVWTENGSVRLFLGHHESSTLLLGKRVPKRYNQQIDYNAPQSVPCLDFSAWMRKEFSAEDNVIVKMNIEGAEYPILAKMIEDDTLQLISILLVEWHYDRFETMTRQEHESLVEAVSSRISVQPWGQIPVDDGGPGLA